jgi:hypothetical protein
MSDESLQAMCDRGQLLLMATDYLSAERVLAKAESIAWEARDWDTLSRLYMPLQESRRQRRQRCGEGVVRLDLIAANAHDVLEPNRIVDAHPHGQLLVAGWASIEPARQVRAIAAEQQLYVDCFLAAVYPVNAAHVIAIVPTDHVALPPADGRSIDQLAASLPPHSILIPASGLHAGARPGNDTTYAETMAMWERLHAPFLAAADGASDPVRRMIEYRHVLAIDYACELAHQNLSKTARRLLQK